MERSFARVADWLAIGALACLGAIAVLTFRDYGLGWDDYTHSQYGELLLNLYASAFKDQRALSFVNLYMFGGGFDMAAALLHKVLPFGLFETRRLWGAAVGIAGIAATWQIGRRIGGPWAGLIALLLLAAYPLYYGHMYMNAKDAPFAAAMALLLLALARTIEDYPRPRLATVVLFGFGLGLSFGSRILGGIGALYMIAPLALLIGQDLRAGGVAVSARNFGRFLFGLVPGFALAYGIMALVWPWSALDPANPIRAVGYFSHFFEKPWNEMFEGALISVPDMPRSYVPLHFLLKTPEILIVLSLGAIVGIATGAIRNRFSTKQLAVLALVASAALIPILVAVATRPAMYNGIRHFVFVAPAIAVLGGLAAAWILEWAGRRSRAWMAAILVVLTIGLIDPIVAMVRLHPYQYTSFNRFAGGVEGAEDRFMIDYWGLAFKEASQRLRAKLTAELQSPKNRRRWRIAVCGPHPPAEVELGPEFVTTWDPKSADFAMMLGEFYCAELNAPVLVEVEREHVTYARVYDIRGLNITTLFTIPPVR